MSLPEHIIGLIVVHDLLEFLQVLHLLYQQVRPVVRLPQQRGDLGVEHLAGLIDVLLRLGEPLVLDVQDRLVEVALVRVLGQVEQLHVALEVVPVSHVPGRVAGELADLLHLRSTLDVLRGTVHGLRGRLLVPHALNQEGEVLPVEGVAETVHLALQDLEVVRIELFLLLVDLQCVFPTMQLLIPVFLLID